MDKGVAWEAGRDAPRFIHPATGYVPPLHGGPLADNPVQENRMDDRRDVPADGVGFGAHLKRVLSVPGDVVRDAAGAVLSTSRFLASRQYRNEIGYPWLKDVVARNKKALWQEISESDEMLRLLWRFARGESLNDEQQKHVREQLLDLARVVPALGIFALPGGAVLLPVLARMLPWDLLPSSFRAKEGISEEDVEQIVRTEIPDGPEG
jgi:hypothetical protein